MFGIKINNQFLTLYPKTVFSFELSNPAYLGDKVESIDNGIVFSTEVPLTSPNDALLKYPHLIENEWNFLKNAPCEVYKNGRRMFKGILSVKESRFKKRSATLNVVINTISDLKGKKLQEMDLGTLPPLVGSLEDYTTDTVYNPLNHQCVFAPVYNRDFRGNDKDNGVHSMADYQNLFKSATKKVTWLDGSLMTPFVRLDVALKAIFESVNYSVINKFQTNNELKQLLVYNNNALQTAQEVSNYAINRTMPSGTAEKIIGQICRLYCLAPYANVFEETVEITPFSEVVDRDVKHVWTKYLLSLDEITELDNYPSMYAWKEGSDWKLPSVDTLQALRVKPITEPSDARISPTPTNIPYRYEYQYAHNAPFKEGLLVNLNDTIEIYGSDDTWESEVTTLTDAHIYLPPNTDAPIDLPAIKLKGNLTPYENNECPTRLIQYRGVRKYDDGRTFPISTAELYTYFDNRPSRVGLDIDGYNNGQYGSAPMPQYALTWGGDAGIYNQFHKKHHAFLIDKKEQKARFALPIDVFLQFSFADKVRVKNMNYLVKKLRGTLRAEGDSIELEAALVRDI